MVGLASRAVEKRIIFGILDFDLFELALLAIAVRYLCIVARFASTKNEKDKY